MDTVPISGLKKDAYILGRKYFLQLRNFRVEKLGNQALLELFRKARLAFIE